MDIKTVLSKYLHEISGSVIALIYTFEGEDAKGFKHYDYWRSAVISDWICAVEQIGCKPYIIDVKTFITKASMGTLPHIDICVNLNAGNSNIDNLCLVPSICSFVDIKCIPCSAKTCAVGEDKIFANYIASTGKLKLPREHSCNEVGGIIKDRSFGSSVNVRKTDMFSKCSKDEFCQEFIQGTDMTIAILFNPVSKQFEVLPPVLYKHAYGETWFLSEKAKLEHCYEKVLCSLNKEAEDAVLQLVDKFDITTYCRIDTRVVNFDFNLTETIKLQDIYFIEMNPTPTIHNKINFAMSILDANENIPHKQNLEIYKNIVKNPTVTGYILLCSALSLKARHSL